MVMQLGRVTPGLELQNPTPDHHAMWLPKNLILELCNWIILRLGIILTGMWSTILLQKRKLRTGRVL